MKGTETISSDSIIANLPVTVNFEGNAAAAGISITSSGSVVLLGSLANLNGQTSITSQQGSITQGNSGLTVEGAQVVLSAATGIGTNGMPVNVVLAASGVANVSAYLSATTTNGAINIAAPQGALALNTISAGGDQDVTLSAFGAITVASGTPSYGSTSVATITGGSVTLTSGGGGIGAAAASVNLAGGQSLDDQFNLVASGDVYINQVSGNLQLFALTTPGDATITIENGSLENVNTNVQLDNRTVAQLGVRRLERTGPDGCAGTSQDPVDPERIPALQRAAIPGLLDRP